MSAKEPRPIASDTPKVGFVSLGCPKALVDSERILTRLSQQGYETSSTYAGADVVVVNTCGFLDSAKEESLDAIAEAIASNAKVVVTGCMGNEAELIRARFPKVAAITGAHQYDAVIEAVHTIIPPRPELFHTHGENEMGIKLTPKHYAYLKIAEGCDHRCSFCIIPSLRGNLVSRPIADVLREAESMVANGVKEILVISQDTSAYGLDLKYAGGIWRGKPYRSSFEDLARGLGELGVWIRMHYVYPYPHVEKVIPFMTEGKILPYLDIPFQHASPKILKSMKRPGNQERTLEHIQNWRKIAPNLAIRSTFIVGFPGETEHDFELLLDWLEAAQLDRVGAFAYENVEGAPAQALADHVPEDIKQDRLRRFMAVAARISEDKLRAKQGELIEVIVDTVQEGNSGTGRTLFDAPEIDGKVYLNGFSALAAGNIVRARITRSDSHDLWAEPENYVRLNRVPIARKKMHRVISRI